jgi:hypothetical protein
MGISLLFYHYSSTHSGLVAGKVVCPSAVTLLGNGELDTLTLGQRNPWLLTANDTAGY